MITLQQITKTFNKGKPNEVFAVKKLDLTIEQGQFAVVVGSNGSGKTTLLNLIAGSLLPTSGTITIAAEPVTKLADYERSRWIARVFQSPLSGTASDLSILDNFRLAALRTKRKGLSIGVNSEFKAAVKDKIAMLGMGLENKTEQLMGTPFRRAAAGPDIADERDGRLQDPVAGRTHGCARPAFGSYCYEYRRQADQRVQPDCNTDHA